MSSDPAQNWCLQMDDSSKSEPVEPAALEAGSSGEIGDAKQLALLCRQGRLFEVDQWLKSKPLIEDSKQRRSSSPMYIAIDRGFHSLVEVLLRHGASPNGRNLLIALERGRPDLVELFFQYGADPKSVSLAAVMDRTIHPEILKQFIERGADLQHDYPIAKGLMDSVQPLLGICRTYLPRCPELKFQINMALRHHCEKGHLGSVCKLLWLGADPRERVPQKPDEDPEMWMSSVEAAICEGHFEIVEKFGLQPTRDDLNQLLILAANTGEERLIKYLISAGANPNFVDADGQSALARALWMLHVSTSRGFESCYSFQHEQAEAFRVLVKSGVKLTLDQKEEIKLLRGCLSRFSRHQALEMIRFLKASDFCDDEVFIMIIDNPGMKRHLTDRFAPLARIIPYFKKWSPPKP